MLGSCSRQGFRRSQVGVPLNGGSGGRDWPENLPGFAVRPLVLVAGELRGSVVPDVSTCSCCGPLADVGDEFRWRMEDVVGGGPVACEFSGSSACGEIRVDGDLLGVGVGDGGEVFTSLLAEGVGKCVEGAAGVGDDR